MRIVNVTRNTVLAEKAWKTETARQRMKGLLGRDGLEPGEALYISPCTSIHSFFMRFVFDAAFVGNDGRVLHVIHKMKRWRMSRLVPKAAGVIELPPGVLEQTGTCTEDRLRFEDAPVKPAR